MNGILMDPLKDLLSVPNIVFKALTKFRAITLDELYIEASILELHTTFEYSLTEILSAYITNGEKKIYFALKEVISGFTFSEKLKWLKLTKALTLGNKEDKFTYDFLDKLNKIRNAVAHREPKNSERLIYNKKSVYNDKSFQDLFNDSSETLRFLSKKFKRVLDQIHSATEKALAQRIAQSLEE